jgi:DNA polymerase-3 subunit gamma/tau
MSTLVLARKYRPRDFDSLVGQPHVVQALANALTQQRLHHAYLFTGTRGVGKTTISRILAKSLNCTGVDGTGGITAKPCGACDACREIDAGRYIDYIELDAASNRGVDEITQLLDQSVYKPVTGRFKVYMIDEVHMLSNHAFNAMLKSLEEPPDYLKFVLATTDPQKVPPTVLSRCLQFNLRPLAPQTVHEHLATVLDQERIERGGPALQLIARAARGSMRDALSLTDQAIAHGAGAIDEAGVRQMLGAVDRGHAVRLVEALAVRGWRRRHRRDRPAPRARTFGGRHPRGDGCACCSRWRCCRSSPRPSMPTIPTRLRRFACRRCSPRTRRNCSTASSCTDALSLPWRRTSTAAW